MIVASWTRFAMTAIQARMNALRKKIGGFACFFATLASCVSALCALRWSRDLSARGLGRQTETCIELQSNTPLWKLLNAEEDVLCNSALGGICKRKNQSKEKTSKEWGSIRRHTMLTGTLPKPLEGSTELCRQLCKTVQSRGLSRFHGDVKTE